MLSPARFFVVLLLLVAGACGSLPLDAPRTDDPAAMDVETMFSGVNAERKARGLPPLRGSELLTKAAQIHAEQMAIADKLAHELPGSPHPTIQSRLAAVKYDYRWFGETIAFNHPGSDAVVRGWMKSTVHRNILLDSNPIEVGGAIAKNRYGAPYFILVVGRPR